ncbi:hypothetical protein KC723_01530 [Candidatus Kaiserbacteria bacterium]|nr:hypothetical protein [Candidatus Kaiserbacteria bacterium]
MIKEHHARLFVADSLLDVPAYKELDSSSPDVVIIDRPRFAIADVREMNETAHRLPIKDNERVVVLRTDVIALEAQQALLKTLEEPPTNTLFILVIKDSSNIIPTIWSRVLFEGDLRNNKQQNDSFDTFMNSPYKDRLEWIVKITKDKDRVSIDEVLTGVLISLTRWYQEKLVTKEAMESILSLSIKASLPGSSLKMILEEIALSVPVLKR